MEIDNVPLLTYQELLSRIKGGENHLLLGNGFNRGLGVNTSYKAIFKKMINGRNSIYQDIEQLAIDCEYDLEIFIGELSKDVKEENEFLRKFINNKVKMDFMQATHEIVKSEIKKVYAENNEGVYMLLKEFTNYFTLNYDSFLYLLLLNYKTVDKPESNSIAIQPTLNFIEEDLNIQHNNIYEEIKNIRNGFLKIEPDVDSNPTNTPINKVNQGTFTTIIKQYSKSSNKNWSSREIDQVVKHIIEKEKVNQVLEHVDDGAQLTLFNEQEEFEFNLNSKTQNLFFLHGAFHIYKDNKRFLKITKQSDKALYERLENILNNEEQEIVCVFQTENKLETIKENEYLMKCYNKLSNLSGNLVILGSALSENDAHIFTQISKSKIADIFIATTSFTESVVEKACNIFPEKNIVFFDVNTISYENH